MFNKKVMRNICLGGMANEQLNGDACNVLTYTLFMDNV